MATTSPLEWVLLASVAASIGFDVRALRIAWQDLVFLRQHRRNGRLTLLARQTIRNESGRLAINLGYLAIATGLLLLPSPPSKMRDVLLPAIFTATVFVRIFMSIGDVRTREKLLAERRR